MVQGMAEDQAIDPTPDLTLEGSAKVGSSVPTETLVAEPPAELFSEDDHTREVHIVPTPPGGEATPVGGAPAEIRITKDGGAIDVHYRDAQKAE